MQGCPLKFKIQLRMSNTMENEVIKLNRKFDDSKEKRQYLRELSKKAKFILSLGSDEFETVNEVLVDQYTNQEGEESEFHTFKEWKRRGYTIKKGETAFLVWGKPRKLKAEDAAEEEEKEGTSFFPVAHLFSSNQVERSAKNVH